MEAILEDTSTMVIQIEEMKSVLAQVAGLSDKGSTPLVCERADRNTQICTAKDSVKFVSKNARQGVRRKQKSSSVCTGQSCEVHIFPEEEYRRFIC